MRRLLSIVLPLIGLAVPLQAQWTVGAYLGGGHTAPADLTIRRPDGTRLTFPGVSFDGRSFTSPPYYGYRFGRRLPGFGALSLEAELIHLKAYAQVNDATGFGRSRGEALQATPLAEHLRRFSMSHGLNFVMVNGVLRHELQSRRTVLVTRGGVGALVPHAESETPAGRIERYQVAGIGIQGAGGVEIRLLPWLYAAAEYKYTHGRCRVEIAGGTAAVTTRSHHMTVGITLAPPAR